MPCEVPPSNERRTLTERLEPATWVPTTEIDEDFPETTFLQPPETWLDQSTQVSLLLRMEKMTLRIPNDTSTQDASRKMLPSSSCGSMTLVEDLPEKSLTPPNPPTLDPKRVELSAAASMQDAAPCTYAHLCRNCNGNEHVDARRRREAQHSLARSPLLEALEEYLRGAQAARPTLGRLALGSTLEATACAYCAICGA